MRLLKAEFSSTGCKKVSQRLERGGFSELLLVGRGREPCGKGCGQPLGAEGSSL